MHDIQDRLDRYLDLTPDERQALAADVAAHQPDLAEELAEVRALAAVFEAVAGQGLPAEDTLAHLAARDHLEGHGQPKARPDRFAADADLRHAFFSLRDRIEHLDRALPDPIEQFEALTGHRIDSFEPRVHQLHPDRQAPAREPVPRARLHTLRARFTQYAVAACFGLLALYGGLAIASRSSVSEWDRLGAIDADALAIEGFGGTLRGDGAAPASNDARYLDALERVEEARRSTLGLFPRYDEAALRQAQRQLESIVMSEERGSFLQLEASFVLGKTLILMEQPDAARPHLLRVVDLGGRHADAAARTLASLEALRPTD